MSSTTIKIKLFSDYEDTTSISGAVKQVQLSFPAAELIKNPDFKIEEDDIIILQIKTLDSPFFNTIIDSRDEIENKIIFVIPENDALLVSSLAKLGFSEIFVIPYEIVKLVNYLKEVIENNSFVTSSPQVVNFEERESGFNTFIGESPVIKKVLSVAKKLTDRDDINILISGETGTGKGLLAKAIHQNGSSKDSPFVEILCTTIPEALIESELFGYEAGAFTSARTKKLGLFELAENGTIFLDEVGELNPSIQIKLLRTLEKKVLRRLGGTNDIPFNAKIISATSHNLSRLVDEGKFRNDLFHRLYVVSLEIPPLRKRGEDILILTEHFMTEYNNQFQKQFTSIEPALKNFLMEHPWTGNVRELRNSVERAVLLGDGKKLKLSHFLFLRQKKEPVQLDDYQPPANINLNIDYKQNDLRTLSKIYARTILQKENGNKSKTAKFLGISRPKLDSLLD